jgi:hypothetical protein
LQRSFGKNLKLSLFIGGLRDCAIFEVTNWKPSDFRILPRYAYFNKIAIQQMQVLEDNEGRKLLK